MKATEDGYTLSTGREIDANARILGIAPQRDGYGRLRITQGYDGDVREDEPDYENDRAVRGDAFTAAERQEIAEYVIALWREWAAQDSASP